MLLSGVEPNYVTIASILPLCARVANLQHGKEFHCYIIRRKVFDDYLLLWNALVAMYARSGKLLAAKHVFDLIQKRDEVTYTSLIAGYGMQDEGHTAMKLFEEMVNLQIKPDHVTMVAVLSACSHCGLVLEGQLWFKKMQSLYGIVPRLEHFSCMVDLYGRAGLLNKAKETITRMPYKPTTAMWATLLGACRIHGNTDIGEWAAEKLLELRPENSGYCVDRQHACRCRLLERTSESQDSDEEFGRNEVSRLYLGGRRVSIYPVRCGGHVESIRT
ncbi:Pentatricopeptide repeat-containing protein [Hibiscus syriacus]|uniref:Pentatricopeptide repeat-containing protein n=1 Tax=Hibiscus syriacus TaxID=106335 RepID=A0A6A3ANH8_HIBSY|nr:Pentatricopeptide repeat-containing protein [Hibiscus syriacus]